MGQRYFVYRTLTPTAGNDIWTIVPAANRRVTLVQFILAGQGTTSAAQQLLLSRSSGGTTPGGAATPDPFDNADQPAAASTVDTTWAAQPTLGTHQIPIGVNALGGWAVYNPPRSSGLSVRGNAAYISVRANSTGITYQAMGVTAVFEED